MKCRSRLLGCRRHRRHIRLLCNSGRGRGGGPWAKRGLLATSSLSWGSLVNQARFRPPRTRGRVWPTRGCGPGSLEWAGRKPAPLSGDASELRRVDGSSGSCSRMMRRASSKGAVRRVSGSKGSCRSEVRGAERPGSRCRRGRGPSRPGGPAPRLVDQDSAHGLGGLPVAAIDGRQDAGYATHSVSMSARYPRRQRADRK